MKNSVKHVQKSKKKPTYSFNFHMKPGFLRSLLVITGVIFVWRGLWGLMDTYLFPDQPGLSFTVGLIIGMIMLYVPDDDLKELI